MCDKRSTINHQQAKATNRSKIVLNSVDFDSISIKVAFICSCSLNVHRSFYKVKLFAHVSRLSSSSPFIVGRFLSSFVWFLFCFGLSNAYLLLLRHRRRCVNTCLLFSLAQWHMIDKIGLWSLSLCLARFWLMIEMLLLTHSNIDFSSFQMKIANRKYLPEKYEKLFPKLYFSLILIGQNLIFKCKWQLNDRQRMNIWI